MKPDLTEIVNGIKAEKPEAWEQLYQQFKTPLLYALWREYPAIRDHHQDILSDALLTTVLAIRRGLVEKPDALFGYARIIALRRAAECRYRQRQSYTQLDVIEPIHACSFVNAEKALCDGSNLEHLKRYIEKLKPEPRQIIIRFYLEGEKPEKIQREMGLNDKQFRLRKSRALIKLIALVKGKKSVSVQESGRGRMITMRELRATA